MTETRNLSRFASIANAAFNSMTANSTAITSMTVGGASINATSFAGTANNSTNLNGQAASFYTNASNLSTGTLPDARLSSAVVNTSGAFTLGGNINYNANLTIASTGELIIANGAGIFANGTLGTAGQALFSNGTGVYWGVDSVNTASTFAWTNTHTFAANVAFDTSTLFIDATNDRVGVGTTSPTVRLDVNGVMLLRAQGGADGGEFFLARPPTSTTLAGDVAIDINTNSLRIYENGGSFRGLVADLTACGSQSALLHSANFNSYAPTLTGTGASGNWGINITGNAATVTNGVYTTGDQTIGGNKTFNGSLRNFVSSGWSTLYLGGQFNSYAWFHIGGDTNANDLRIARANRSTLAWEANQFFFDLTSGIFTAAGESRTPIFRLTSDTNSYWAANEFVLRGGSPTIFFRDIDHNSAMLHNNSSLFYVLRGNNDTTSWNTVGSGWWPLTINLTNNDISLGGTIYAAYNIVAYASDRRLKENITEIPYALDKLKKIRGVTFDWSDKAEELGFKPDCKYNDVGVIAQEIEEVMPQVVTLAPFDKWIPDPGKKYTDEELTYTGKSRSGENYKTVQYDRIVPLLIQAIKEQQAQIEVLQAKIMEVGK